MYDLNFVSSVKMVLLRLLNYLVHRPFSIYTKVVFVESLR